MNWRRTIKMLALLLVCSACGDGTMTAQIGTGTRLTIATPPANETVSDGDPVSFSVTANGHQPLSYQWKRGSDPVPGASSSVLSIPRTIYAYDNKATYSVIVTDASGSQVTSLPAVLTIAPKPPVISETPLSETVVPGSTGTFSVSAAGTIPLSYQWNLNGVSIPGATAPSYTTGVNLHPQNQPDAYSVTVTNGAGQTTTSAPADLTVATTAVVPTINVDCSEQDAAVAHQVTYRRGVVESFDQQRAPPVIVGNLTGDVQAPASNFLNATLDINSSPDAALFTYSAQQLVPSASGNAPLMQTFSLLNSAIPPGTLSTSIQVSGTPAAYSNFLDQGYELSCGATGEFYPLPAPGSPMQATQKAVESWIEGLSQSFPGAIWIGTQEPSHTLGYPTLFDAGGCTNVPDVDLDAAMSANIQRFITYWAPIAQFLRANHIQSGGVQLNAGNSVFYVPTARQIITTQMPLDYFTIQDYTPSPTVNQSLYSAYEEFQQNPAYLSVKVIIDRYGISLTGNTYGTSQGVIRFLQDERQLMPYSDMMYGYAVETKGIDSTNGPTILPQVLKWLQSAPAPLRPLTSTTSDLQAFALVQKGSPQRAYIAIWNVSPESTSYDTSLVLQGLTRPFSAAHLTVLKGSGNTISELNDPRITVEGNTINGLSLKVNEFLLISLQ